MKCHYCGAELHGNELFCRHCGTRQDRKAAPEIAVEPTPLIPEPAPVEMPAEPVPAPVYEERTFDLKPLRGEEPDAPLPEATYFDFEKAASLSNAPKLQLPTGRSLVKMIFLGILTLGIYPVVIWSRLVSEVNITASRYDGERSMSFFGMVMLAPLTLGIHSLVWMSKLCRRIGSELQRRNLNYAFSAKDFWLWCFLLSFLGSVCIGTGSALYFVGYQVYGVLCTLLVVGILTLIGPFVFTNKLMQAMNRINEDFNVSG